MENEIRNTNDLIGQKSINYYEQYTVNVFGEISIIINEENILDDFSPTEKEFFIFLTVHSIIYPSLNNHKNIGINNELISSSLWFDSNKTQIKNYKGVLLNRLRKKIEIYPNIKILNKDRFHYVEFKSEKEIDWFTYLILKKYNKAESKMLDLLLGIFERGSFLKYSSYLWLDELQQSINNDVIHLLSSIMDNKELNLPIRKKAAEILLVQDPLYEEAAIYLIDYFYSIRRFSKADYIKTIFSKNYKSIFEKEWTRIL